VNDWVGMNNQRPSIGQGLVDLGADRGDFGQLEARNLYHQGFRAELSRFSGRSRQALIANSDESVGIVIFSTYCLSNLRELAQR
jgi:hypothetical protein